MALQMNLTLENGINLPAAYLKIVEYKHSLKVGQVQHVYIILNIYKDKDARFNKKPEVIQFYHECSGDDITMYFNESIIGQNGISVLSQCYEWLKSLPIYSSAISVIDEK